MTAQSGLRVSLEEFEQFVQRPENTNKLFEYIGGEIIEAVSYDISSTISAFLLIKIGAFVVEHHLGFMTDAQGGYRIGPDDLIPDCAFVSKEHRRKPQGEVYATVIPSLVVEVKSTSDSYVGLVAKAASYLKYGVGIVWLVLPEKHRVEIFTADGIVIAENNGKLDGGAVLPGFTLKVSDIFANLE